MKKLVSLVFLLTLATSALANGRQLVAFKNGVPAGFESAVAAQGGTVVFKHDILAIVDGLSVEGAAAVGALSGVAEVQADEEFFLDDVAVSDAEADFATPDSPTVPSTAFFFPRQWHMRAIGAHTAWAAGRLGSPNVTVAILDSGIDYKRSQHADLNGLVDHALGAQFTLDNPTCIAPGFLFDPTDDLMFHGTHVAATVSSNALAAAGVTSRTRLVPVKVLGYTRNAAGVCGTASGSLSAVLAGVLHAADIDADVANMSLGGGFAKAGNGRFIGLINRTFNYALRQGTLVVVSAGNEAIDLDHDGNFYKTYCSTPNTVCVSATGPTAAAGTNGPWTNVDALAGYSNYGSSAINVAAPGGNAAPVTAACSRAAQGGLAICRTGTFVVGSNGTSMASPHVSGLAALIVETIGKNKPAQVKAILQQSADDLGKPGTDPAYGKGRINVPRALGLQ
jgi:lantibiotic leader peptide-processing serine protease